MIEKHIETGIHDLFRKTNTVSKNVFTASTQVFEIAVQLYLGLGLGYDHEGQNMKTYGCFFRPMGLATLVIR